MVPVEALLPAYSPAWLPTSSPAVTTAMGPEVPVIWARE